MRQLVQLGNSAIVVEHLRAWSVVQPPHSAYPLTNVPITYVWISEVAMPFGIEGDHHAALRAAVRGEDWT